MPDYDAQPHEISREIGNKQARACEHAVPIEKIADNRWQAAFERVAQKRDKADFQPKFTRHIHRAGITTAHLRDIAVFLAGNEPRKIKTADKIAYDSQQ